MASEFINDLKKPVALLSLAISIIALTYTAYNQFEQDRRWDALNTGRIDITNVGFLTYRVMSKKEVLNTDFGIKASFSYALKDEVVTDRIKIPFAYVVWDISKNDVAIDDTFLTFSEARAAIAQNKLNSSLVAVYLYYSAYFKVANIGLSPLQDVSFTVTSDLNLSEVRLSKEANKLENWKLDYLPGKTFSVYYGFYAPLDKPQTQEIIFRVTVKYKNMHGIQVSQAFSYRTDTVSDIWNSISPS